MSEDVICRFKYTEAEVLAVRAASRTGLAAKGNPAEAMQIISWPKAILIIAALGLVLGAGLLGVVRQALVQLDIDGWDAESVAAWSLAGWLGFASAIGFLMVLARRADKAALAVPDHPGQTASIGEDALTLTTDHCVSRYQWDAYVSAELSQGAILLRDRLSSILVLPERGFESPASRDRAWEIVCAKIGRCGKANRVIGS